MLPYEEVGSFGGCFYLDVPHPESEHYLKYSSGSTWDYSSLRYANVLFDLNPGSKFSVCNPAYTNNMRDVNNNTPPSSISQYYIDMQDVTGWHNGNGALARPLNAGPNMTPIGYGMYAYMPNYKAAGQRLPNLSEGLNRYFYRQVSPREYHKNLMLNVWLWKRDGFKFDNMPSSTNNSGSGVIQTFPRCWRKSGGTEYSSETPPELPRPDARIQRHAGAAQRGYLAHQLPHARTYPQQFQADFAARVRKILQHRPVRNSGTQRCGRRKGFHFLNAVQRRRHEFRGFPRPLLHQLAGSQPAQTLRQLLEVVRPEDKQRAGLPRRRFSGIREGRPQQQGCRIHRFRLPENPPRPDYGGRRRDHAHSLRHHIRPALRRKHARFPALLQQEAVRQRRHPRDVLRPGVLRARRSQRADRRRPLRTASLSTTLSAAYRATCRSLPRYTLRTRASGTA